VEEGRIGPLRMTIKIRKPELERLIREQILSGRFQGMDELLTKAVQALRERRAQPAPASRPRKNLAQLLLESPFAGSDLDLERHRDCDRSAGL